MKSYSNPIIKVNRSKFEKVFDIIALFIYFASIVYLIADWPSIPDKVPGHYNLAGEVTRWDSKAMLFLMPIIGLLIIWVPSSVLERYPHLHNYSRLTEENAERLYKNSIRMMNVMKNEILILFSLLNLESVYIAKNEMQSSLLGGWDMVISLVIIFGSIAFFIWKSFKLR
ncbi:DUF1648 domain-containing protein [Oceanobacillus piezotolerans]|uniref:DUF1648 domain-containing protein n=1 Tax=Oceanobacillus piezotolerans TaxID=2448030 RepID=A0A498DA37_9BACI|nr:DUF1648 domain-containing protein [Oceanobacillus piezotolerans]RLL46604.1 DUF1648 domain-containing protein [Oceanobacillus piezotolerans]